MTIVTPPVSDYFPAKITIKKVEQIDPQILNRIAASLGLTSDRLKTADVNEVNEVNEILEVAAQRLEKAAVVMGQLNGLFQSAQRSGFQGNSVSLMLGFVSEKLQAGQSRNEVASRPVPVEAAGPDSNAASTTARSEINLFAQACEQLEPDLAFHDAHQDTDPALLRRACLRIIGEAAARIQAQRTTIEILAQPLAGKS